jgi:glycerol-3-phosphate dehydrogenase
MAISLTKGMRVRPDGPQLISQMVSSYLNVDCSVLMGANIAADIGQEQLSEAVIGYTNVNNAQVGWRDQGAAQLKGSTEPGAASGYGAAVCALW